MGKKSRAKQLKRKTISQLLDSSDSKLRKQIISQCLAWTCGWHCPDGRGDCHYRGQPNECPWGVIDQEMTEAWQKIVLESMIKND